VQVARAAVDGIGKLKMRTAVSQEQLARVAFRQHAPGVPVEDAIKLRLRARAHRQLAHHLLILRTPHAA
jgi:hypothetical protein